jgi:hypothetical protein
LGLKCNGWIGLGEYKDFFILSSPGGIATCSALHAIGKGLLNVLGGSRFHWTLMQAVKLLENQKKYNQSFQVRATRPNFSESS